MFLEVALVRPEPVVERDVERGCGAERAANSRRGEATDQTEISHRLSQRRADFLETLSGTLNAVQRNEETQDLVCALEDTVDARIAEPALVRVGFHESSTASDLHELVGGAP